MNETPAARFLIVRLGSLGDIVHTVPAVAALRETFPTAGIDWVAEQKWSALLELVTCIDGITALERTALGYLSCIRGLRRARYSCAVDFQGLYKSAFLARSSGAARRVGRDRRSVREPGVAHFYTDRVHPTGRHIAEMNLSLAIGAGAARPAELRFPLRVPPQAMRQVREMLLRDIGDFIVVSPGGGWKSKCWPADRYGALCAEVWRKHGVSAVINTGPGEEDLARDLMEAAAPSKPLTLSLPLASLAALLAQAKVVVAADTGPLHLAAALGTRTVGLFGPTDPARNGPLPGGLVLRNGPDEESVARGVDGRVADERGAYERGDTYSPSMLSLSVAQVCEGVERELAASS